MKTNRELILEMLEHDGLTVAEIHTLLIFNPRTTICDVVYRLHRRKLIYISGWNRTSCKPAAVFKLGNKKDAPKIKPLKPKERAAAYRARNPALVSARRRSTPAGPFDGLLYD